MESKEVANRNLENKRRAVLLLRANPLVLCASLENKRCPKDNQLPSVWESIAALTARKSLATAHFQFVDEGMEMWFFECVTRP